MLIQTSNFMKNRKIIKLMFAILGTFFIISATNQKNKLYVIPIEQSAYKIVIFDIGDVLLTTSSSAKRSMILSALISNPTLLYYLVNFSVKEEYFKVLHSVPAQSNAAMYNKGEQMPAIMVDWQLSITSCKEIKSTVIHHIQQTDHPAPIQNLFIAIAEFMFTPETLAASQNSITSMVRLAQELKKAGYQIFALSNWDKESFEIARKNHQEIFDLFDGILVSGQEHIGKPAAEFYQRLLKNHNLTISDCIFIDDEPFNIKAAQELGIKSILCDKPATVMQELIEIGVLTR